MQRTFPPIILLLLGLLAAGCRAAPAVPPAPEDQPAAPVELRFGVGFGSASPLFMPVYVAEEQGLFRENGISADVMHLSGSMFIQASAAGDVQMGSISTAAAITGIARGAPLTIVAVVVDRPDWVLLGRRGSSVRGPADLKGKRVLITGFAGATHQMLAILADRYGWDLQQDLVLAPVSSNEAQLATLEQGEADALVASHERALGLQARGLGTIYFEFGDVVPLWADYVVVAHNDLIRDHPGVVRRALRAFYQGVQYVADHPDAVTRRLEEVHNQPPEVAEQVRKQLRYTADGSIDPKAMETVVDTLLKVQALDTRPNLADLYTTQFTPVRP